MQHIQQSLIHIEQTIDGFMLKHSIEEKLLQKEELKVFRKFTFLDRNKRFFFFYSIYKKNVFNVTID